MSFLDTIFKFTPFMRRNTVTPSPANGDLVELQSDDAGRLLVNAGSTSTVWSDAGSSAVAEKVVKASGGKIWQIFGRNAGASAKYLFVFNHAASGAGRPTNGGAPLFLPIKVEAGATFSLELARPRAMGTGIYWGISSTDTTFTYDSGGTFLVAAEYE